MIRYLSVQSRARNVERLRKSDLVKLNVCGLPNHDTQRSGMTMDHMDQ